MMRADERSLDALTRSALITRAFGIANPAFGGGEARLLALFERLYLYTRAIDHAERLLAWHRRPPAGGLRTRHPN